MSLQVTVVLISIFVAIVLATNETLFCTQFNANLFILKLNCTDFGVLRHNFLTNSNETKILLGDNLNITRVVPKVFRNFNDVNTISLANNQIKFLRDYTFDGCQSLKIIYLSGNWIRKFSAHAFETTIPKKQFHLVALSVANNEIKRFKVAILSKCCFKTLKKLDLSKNQHIDKLVTKIIKKFKQLNWITFGNGYHINFRRGLHKLLNIPNGGANSPLLDEHSAKVKAKKSPQNIPIS